MIPVSGLNVVQLSDASFTSVFNALDYPSCVFPVTRVDPVIDAKKPPHQFLSKSDEENYNLCKYTDGEQPLVAC